MREISDFYFKTCGIYSRILRYMAYMYNYDWFVTPDDAVALSANESFNMTGGAFSLMCKTMDMRTSTYNLGDRIRVLLPKNSEAPTTTPNTSENIVLNEGDYIIGHIEFSYSSATGFSTEYLLLQMLY